jgi:hypothetical protein
MEDEDLHGVALWMNVAAMSATFSGCSMWGKCPQVGISVMLAPPMRSFNPAA